MLGAAKHMIRGNFFLQNRASFPMFASAGWRCIKKLRFLLHIHRDRTAQTHQKCGGGSAPTTPLAWRLLRREMRAPQGGGDVSQPRPCCSKAIAGSQWSRRRQR